jgi:hypothetical protein
MPLDICLWVLAKNGSQFLYIIISIENASSDPNSAGGSAALQPAPRRTVQLWRVHSALNDARLRDPSPGRRKRIFDRDSGFADG